MSRDSGIRRCSHLENMRIGTKTTNATNGFSRIDSRNIMGEV